MTNKNITENKTTYSKEELKSIKEAIAKLHGKVSPKPEQKDNKQSKET